MDENENTNSPQCVHQSKGKLAHNWTKLIKKHQIILDIENNIKEILISFEKQILLHKFLSWVKVMTLKAETKIDSSLHKIRKKAQQIDKEIKEKK